jgi:hypothetical protein
MSGPTLNEHVLVLVLLVTGAGLAVRQIILWLENAPKSPDPWDAETDKAVHQPDAVPVCHRCFTPQSPCGWFCRNCGSAVGPYNNYMPYVYVFSEGEVLRNGVTDRMRLGLLIVVGYFLVSLDYFVFAPVYWFFLLRNFKRSRDTVPCDTAVGLS